MKLKHPIVQKLAGFVAAGAARCYGRAMDWRAVYTDPTTDPAHPRHSGRYIYLLWHDAMFMPVILRGSRRHVALTSEHRDGEILSRAMRHLGWSVVRGSSSRRAVPAMLRLLREDRRSICITPDGPRGPRRTMAPGPIFLASRLGLPIVCMGIGYDRPWRLRSWDRFAIPRPFTRGRMVFGPPLPVPPGLDRGGLEAHRAWFERLLNWLTGEAEAWAAGGRGRPGEVPMERGYVPPAWDRPPASSAPPLPGSLAAHWETLSGRPLSVAA